MKMQVKFTFKINDKETLEIVRVINNESEYLEMLDDLKNKYDTVAFLYREAA